MLLLSEQGWIYTPHHKPRSFVLLRMTHIVVLDALDSGKSLSVNISQNLRKIVYPLLYRPAYRR